MRRQMAALLLLGLLCGLTACGDGASAPPEQPEESVSPPLTGTPEESASPPLTGTPEESASPPLTGTLEDFEEEAPEAAVQYYDPGKGMVTFPSREIFLAEAGFWGVKPLYEFHKEQESDVYEDGELTGTVRQTLHMDLYYDEETGAGCGLWYEETPGEEPAMQGFLFSETADGNDETSTQWSRWRIDPFTIPVWEDCYVEDYQEHYEYDEDGRVTGFLADGIYEMPWETEQGRNPVFLADFTYDGDGSLLARSFCQYVFGTTGMIQNSYYDSQERVYYEWSYITHGKLEYYYIYEGDSTEPAYCLLLDHDIGPSIRAEFARY